MADVPSSIFAAATYGMPSSCLSKDFDRINAAELTLHGKNMDKALLAYKSPCTTTS